MDEVGKDVRKACSFTVFVHYIEILCLASSIAVFKHVDCSNLSILIPALEFFLVFLCFFFPLDFMKLLTDSLLIS